MAEKGTSSFDRSAVWRYASESERGVPYDHLKDPRIESGGCHQELDPIEAPIRPNQETHPEAPSIRAIQIHRNRLKHRASSRRHLSGRWEENLELAKRKTVPDSTRGGFG